MAANMVLKVILLKSGRKRNVSPSLAPAVKSEQTAKTASMMKSKGIMILENRSIPFFTPFTMTKWLININTKA